MIGIIPMCLPAAAPESGRFKTARVFYWGDNSRPSNPTAMPTDESDKPTTHERVVGMIEAAAGGDEALAGHQLNNLVHPPFSPGGARAAPPPRRRAAAPP